MGLIVGGFIGGMVLYWIYQIIARPFRKLAREMEMSKLDRQITREAFRRLKTDKIEEEINRRMGQILIDRGSQRG